MGKWLHSFIDALLGFSLLGEYGSVNMRGYLLNQVTMVKKKVKQKMIKSKPGNPNWENLKAEKLKNKNKKGGKLVAKSEFVKQVEPKDRKKLFVVAGILGGCLLLILISLIILLVIKPTISAGFISTDISSKKLAFNAENHNLEIGDSNIITFSNGKEVRVRDYEYVENDFEEGDNAVKVRGYIDLFFIVLVSTDEKELSISVDRIKPALEIRNLSGDFLLLEDLNLELKFSEAATLYQDGEMKELFDAGKVDYVAEVIDGKNNFEFFAVDALGNNSETITIDVNAFMNKNYTREECNGFAFPLSSTLQYGYSGLYNRDSYVGYISEKEIEDTLEYVRLYSSRCDAEDVTFVILPKGSLMPCINCGGSLFHLSINSVEQQEYQVINYTTKSGVKGHMGDYSYYLVGDYEGNHTKRVFEFKSGGRCYQITIPMYDGSEKQVNDFNDIVESLKIGE